MKFHIVKTGETIDSIARKYDQSTEAIRELNRHLSNESTIQTGMKIRVPSVKVEQPTRKAYSKTMPLIREDEPYISDKELKPYQDNLNNHSFTPYYTQTQQNYYTNNPYANQYYQPNYSYDFYAPYGPQAPRCGFTGYYY
ncbi:LysM peptidoglycan-binding domain-containing protein [Halalkalibacillus halophilus]|uniref:LysM peptidoglycan-binding domain-containing protein n=1 Tax=Halalkalibacillus halophilus TaxID=392827 RepID=UPI000407BB4B|nr:LysM domain-containing protein [Halalkalibacillus halophilus]